MVFGLLNNFYFGSFIHCIKYEKLFVHRACLRNLIGKQKRNLK